MASLLAYRIGVVRTSNVVEDARESAGQKPKRQGLGWLGAGLLVGAGIAVLALGVDTPSQPVATTIPPVETRPGNPVGIGSVIPGFPDGLLATTRQEGLSLTLALWPESGNLIIKSVPVGSSSPPRVVEFDVGGHQLATLVPVRDSSAGVLYAGVPESASIISTDVTSFAWHDSLPRTLAYTTQSDAETVVWVATGGLGESEVVVRVVGIEGGLRAWGEWGYAMQDRDDIVRFSPQGEIRDTATGRILDSHSSGSMAIDGDGIELLPGGGGPRPLESGAIDEGTGEKASALGAAFSNDGSRLAELSGAGLTVLSVADDTRVAESAQEPGMNQVLWSTDDRFVLYPAAARCERAQSRRWRRVADPRIRGSDRARGARLRGADLTSGNGQLPSSLAGIRRGPGRIDGFAGGVRRLSGRHRPGNGLLPLGDPRSHQGLGYDPEDVTDVVISHHHPDHTINIALFPNARVHDHWAIYHGDSWDSRPAEGFEVAPDVTLWETPGHTEQDITTIVRTEEDVIAFTHLWWYRTAPYDDPLCTRPDLLHECRERVLAVGDPDRPRARRALRARLHHLPVASDDGRCRTRR